MTTTNFRRALLVVPAIALALASCSKDDASSTEAPTATEADTAGDSAAAVASSGVSAACASDKLALKNAGKLTIGTDSPAYGPWFSDDDPANGKGFESAVAFAVAETLGFSNENVSWIKVPFNSSFAPGKKDFDFDINQISITEERKAAVDFSDGYYDVNQAVVALKDSPAAAAKSVADLAKLKFGVQQGTTSLKFVTDVVKPGNEPFVYNTNNDAKAALASKQIDAIVLDLPTAFFVSAVEIEGSVLVGQFPSVGEGEQFGLLVEKGSPLTACLNEAIASLKSSGKLAAIQTEQLATATNTPLFG